MEEWVKDGRVWSRGKELQAKARGEERDAATKVQQTYPRNCGFSPVPSRAVADILKMLLITLGLVSAVPQWNAVQEIVYGNILTVSREFSLWSALVVTIMQKSLFGEDASVWKKTHISLEAWKAQKEVQLSLSAMQIEVEMKTEEHLLFEVVQGKIPSVIINFVFPFSSLDFKGAWAT